MYFVGGYAAQLLGHIPYKGGQTGLAPASLTTGSSLKNPWPAKPDGKIW
jgi:hypothetical protein